mmetsp:Transcript_13202/g.41665  ORF Transcript_13202/g.41665 Transcript_13202/m.41665 type:complete len:302 (+) Transcript_13202:1167-2072(+)
MYHPILEAALGFVSVGCTVDDHLLRRDAVAQTPQRHKGRGGRLYLLLIRRLVLPARDARQAAANVVDEVDPGVGDAAQAHGAALGDGAHGLHGAPRRPGDAALELVDALDSRGDRLLEAREAAADAAGGRLEHLHLVQLRGVALQDARVDAVEQLPEEAPQRFGVLGLLGHPLHHQGVLGLRGRGTALTPRDLREVAVPDLHEVAPLFVHQEEEHGDLHVCRHDGRMEDPFVLLRGQIRGGRSQDALLAAVAVDVERDQDAGRQGANEEKLEPELAQPDHDLAVYGQVVLGVHRCRLEHEG